MKKTIMMMIGAMAVGAAHAQDTYDAANFANTDLNGTARYVGMGGALGALGGDLSSMSDNPAGTGLFRHHEVAGSASLLFTGESGQLGHDKTRGSLDQCGIIFAFNTENRSDRGVQYVNFGVNYHKTRNHFGNFNANIENLNGTLSQTYQIANLATISSYYDAVDRYTGDSYNNWGMLGKLSERNGLLHIDGYENLQDDDGKDLYDKDGNILQYPVYGGEVAQSALYQRHQWGSTTQTDFNVALNVSNQFFFGATVGVYDVKYSRDTWYQEVGNDGHYYGLKNWYDTDGYGFDVKLGAIIRPIPSSPFRIGLTIHTPTWYRLEDQNGCDLYYDNFKFPVDNDYSAPYEYDYRTPWKFGVSLGTTVGNYFAIGAEYEYSDLGTAHYDVSNDMGNNSYFRTINALTKEMLKAQHTFKIGMEVKPADNFAIRAGYNYVSSPFESDAFRSIAYDSPFTETDFCNWKGINRLTFGLGFTFKGGYFDLAYQYQSQKGDFYAFDDTDLLPTEIDNNRSQVIGTVGFRF